MPGPSLSRTPFDDPPAGSTAGSPAGPADGPRAALDDRWLRALATDLVGRPPLVAERGRWIGEPRASYVAHVLSTEEAWRHWLDEQLYYFMLIDSFRPVGTSLDELPALLAKRGMTPRDALHRIALSTSFEARNPGADTFVTVVMEQFCGIEVQRAKRELEIGKAAYDGDGGLFLGSRASNQSDVVRIAATHQDAARHLASREFERLTRSVLSKRERARTGKRLHRSPRAFVEVLSEWLATDAYAERVARGAPLSNRSWVRAIYVDLGGSLPSEDDTEALRSALDGLGDPVPLRSAVVRMLLDGETMRAPRTGEIGDPGAWVDDTFARLLGRAPTADERRAFTEAAGSGTDGPEIVLFTLVTSEEYQSS
ncbi:MAG: hypothetical protein AAGB93_12665 [Planctomycetota bacterium]